MTEKWSDFIHFFLKPVVMLLLLISAWMIGFVAFINHVSELSPPSNLQALDGIVVLTGGGQRVETGLDLLSAKLGKRLLISGVHQHVDLKQIINLPHQHPIPDCCIDLGYRADNTVENAEESKGWAQAFQIQTIYLVTADYHMPRSLMEFQRAAPELTAIPYPVHPDPINWRQWEASSKQLRLLVWEYSKFLLSYLRLQLWQLGPMHTTSDPTLSAESSRQ